MTKSSRIPKLQVRVLAPLLVLGVLILGGCQTATVKAGAVPTFQTSYQAVLLDTGLVYYGKISGLDTEYPVLRDVFYVQQSTDPVTKKVSSMLIRRGNEWHAPSMTVLNAHHIVLVEPVGPNSKVAQLIAEDASKKAN
jgi:hypothetical protein